MRTTIDIDSHLLRQLRADAERRGVSFKDALAGAIRRGLANAPVRGRARKYKCPTRAMGVPAPGYDSDRALRTAAMLEDDEVVRKLAARK